MRSAGLRRGGYRHADASVLANRRLVKTDDQRDRRLGERISIGQEKPTTLPTGLADLIFCVIGGMPIPVASATSASLVQGEDVGVIVAIMAVDEEPQPAQRLQDQERQQTDKCQEATSTLATPWGTCCGSVHRVDYPRRLVISQDLISLRPTLANRETPKTDR